MKLIFVRHGEPCKDHYGISDMGVKEMELLAEYFMSNFKIDEIYSASSLRATESAERLKRFLGKKIITYPWLSEFKYRISIAKGNGMFPWELPPEYWIDNSKMLDYQEVLKTSLFSNSEVVDKTEEVWREIDKILNLNGYERKGNLYVVHKPTMKEIVIVTHFATMAIIMAHLMNVSILITLNLLFMAPSSYTVFASEEINEGKCIFRCLELGSTKHLFGNNELKSEYGRQDEVKKAKERKDGK